MSHIKLVAAIVVVAVVLYAGLTGLRAFTNSDAEVIPIGAMVCLTGDCADWGEYSLKGMQLAVEEINAKGGVLGKPIELVVQDTQEEAALANAISAYQGMIRSDHRLLIGPTWSAAGKALAPIASRDDVVITSPSLGIADFNEAGENIFNTWPHDDVATRALARLAYDRGWKHVAIFSSKQPWEKLQGDVFAEEIVGIGGSVAIKVEPHEDVKDLKTEAIKIIQSNPDVVIFTNFENMGLAAKEIQRLGYKGNKLAVLIDDARVQLAQGGLEKTIYARYPAAKGWFVEAYKKRFSEEPQVTADTAYDTIYVYAQAIEQAGSTDVKAVKDALNAMKEYKGGASGDLVFDGKGGVLKDPVFWQVVDGEFERYQE